MSLKETNKNLTVSSKAFQKNKIKFFEHLKLQLMLVITHKFTLRPK